ncbi:lysozyme [Sphaerisporangium corydalis]|uniref:Lysozyme n=1 Tax=Sphaerisporangium corydalis TaxID=1441875 RepID=A0ABV9EIP7_9ACTN|nr:lysozyme [Sphaerisporangium corydalis]
MASPAQSPRPALTTRAKALAVLALTAMTVTLGAPAAVAAPTPVNPVTHPEMDWMGSQVAKHEPPRNGDVVIRPFAAQTPGLDVSGWQGNVNWSSVAANGARFAYVKATESTSYVNPYFSQQYTGAYNVGIVHGAYHFATPNTSSGAAQADYFIAHGGGWSKDGRTLPGLLDMEWNPYGATCYGLSAAGMVNWILSFSNQYHARTTRWPVIYTATSWWSQCTGNSGDFSSTNPLMLANYNGSPGPMPYNWGYQTIWQFADHGTFPGDQDLFNGDFSRVQALANG